MGREQGGRLGPFLSRRLVDSADLRLKAQVAYELGISVARFDGWEPAEETTHEYDDDGRLTRTETRREPEWDDEARGWALAWIDYKAHIHEACGHYLPDSTDPEAEYLYESELPIRCHACTARARRSAQYSESQQPEALLYPVRRRG